MNICDCGATTWIDAKKQAFTSISVRDIGPPKFEQMPLLRRLTALDDLEFGLGYDEYGRGPCDPAFGDGPIS